MTELASQLRALARAYPPSLVEHQLADLPRIIFHLQLVVARCGPSARVCDVGGGVGLFSLGCAALGMRVMLIDDFRDPVNALIGDDILELHRERGVEVVRRDVIEDGVTLEAETFDAITTFDSIEHWHHSPRRLLHHLEAALRPGGTLVVGAPNRVNLRKRLTTVFGVNDWSPFEEWYIPNRFRGHVREPTVGELRGIASDLGLDHVEVLGRNWLGLTHRKRAIRLTSRVMDRPLRRAPALCSDIYVVGARASRHG
jgi:SAM-dependent methyltransferase